MKQEIARLKKSHILEIAGSHFDESGYEKTQVSVIASEAEVSIGTIYGFFTNKEGLFMAHIHSKIEVAYTELCRKFEAVSDPVDKLVVLIRSKFEDFAKCRHNVQEILVKNPMFLVQIGFGEGNPMQKIYELTAEILKELHAVAPLKSSDFMQLAYNLKALSNGYIERWVYEEFDLVSKSGEVVEFFLEGIKR